MNKIWRKVDLLFIATHQNYVDNLACNTDISILLQIPPKYYSDAAAGNILHSNGEYMYTEYVTRIWIWSKEFYKLTQL
jgi:hypothetical protein